MNVLLLGSGGREHALAWKLAQSSALDTLYAAPGNPGIAGLATIAPLKLEDHRSIVDFCFRNSIGLVVIGPEAPLVDGLADNLRAVGIAVFGPDKKAARLEGSKAFTKKLCERVGIPTAKFKHARALGSALRALKAFDLPVVIKADGLAAGKGVTIAESEDEAVAAIEDIFGGRFGKKGAAVVIEEFMTGEEVSLFALTDGKHFVAFGSAQDHKRAFDGDTGPNTGGMGAYSPASVLTPELEAQAIETIVRPTVQALAQDGTPYIGVLYAGLMLTDEGPKLVEYNCRFGDPECQVLMARFDGDLLALMLAVANGELGTMAPPSFAKRTALAVVIAAKGYPDEPKKGGAIGGIDAAEATGATVFHAGTANADGQLVASGGRVLNVVATGRGIKSAREAAYTGVEAIDYPEGFHRSDIGWREIKRKR
jgi:phosphoribosylamine--glycine ligase